MAKTITFKALIAALGVWCMSTAAAHAGTTHAAACGCTPPPPPPPCNCQQHHHHQQIDVHAKVSLNVNVQTNAAAQVLTAGQAQVSGGGGGYASTIQPGAVSSVGLNVGGEERSAYEAERTRFEKVVIQAFCFDDKDVPHPASQVSPDRDIDEMYEGEVYRCIAGSHMQVTVAQWADKISFEGGKTITCNKGEALWHAPGHGGGKLECRPQIPARDCNERSLLRRFGAGIKVLTLVMVEKYTAYREESHEGAMTQLELDGGVGGIVN